MAPKIFITGTTGYIGGSVLDRLVSEHPEYEFTALLRNPTDEYSEAYPDVKVVKGDYDSSDVITAAAAEAGVVVHNGDSDHEPSIRALIAGLVKRSETTGKPSTLIHLGGTGIVADWQDPQYHGRQNPKIWSDVEDIDAIWSLPDRALHRNVDKIIQQAWNDHGDILKTAIVCPPDIYGKGKGPGRKLSVFMPLFVHEAKRLGATFFAEQGTNTRSWVHVDDLTTIYLYLVEAAVAGGGSAGWGKEGYYFAASQEHNQRDIAEAVGKIMAPQGVIPTAEPKQLSLEDVRGLLSWRGPGLATYQFAASSRTRADRAREMLDYRPSAPSLWKELEDAIVSAEDELHLSHSGLKVPEK